MEAILNLDRDIFFLINGRLTNAALDSIMPFITDKANFYAVAALAVIIMLVNGKRRDLRAFILLIVSVALADYAAAFLKIVFLRIRPCFALDGVRLLVGCGGSYSFPSGHAANIFAAAVILSIRAKRLWPFFIFIALGVSYSRVYVGVHYPLDVAGGAALGAAFALIFTLADRAGIQALLGYLRKRHEDAGT